MEALDKGNTSYVMKSEDKINQSKYFVTLVSYVLKLLSNLGKDRNVIGKNCTHFFCNCFCFTGCNYGISRTSPLVKAEKLLQAVCCRAGTDYSGSCLMFRIML